VNVGLWSSTSSPLARLLLQRTVVPLVNLCGLIADPLSPGETFTANYSALAVK
jgi:hypothetical protein